MKTNTIFLHFLKISVLLILVLTSLCATCPMAPGEYPVTVTAATDNFNPIHVYIQNEPEFRLEPGQSNDLTIYGSVRLDLYPVRVRLVRMGELLHESQVTLWDHHDIIREDRRRNHIMIREVSRGSFTVTHSLIN